MKPDQPHNTEIERRRRHDRQRLLALMREHGDNLRQAALAIGKDQTNLRRRLRVLGIERDATGRFVDRTAPTPPTTDPFSASPIWRVARRGFSRAFLQCQYHEHGENVSAMARTLRIDRSALSRKLTMLEIAHPYPRDRRGKDGPPRTSATAPARSGRSHAVERAGATLHQ